MRTIQKCMYISLMLVLVAESTICFAQDKEDWTKEKLFEAARTGNIEQVKTALESGVDVNSKTDYGATALFYACDRGHEEIVKVLLDAGADPNAKDTFYNATPLTWAQSKGHFNIVGLLFSKGGKGADSMLMTAVAGANVDLAKIVLDSGAVTPKGLKRAKKVVDTKKNEKLSAIFEGLDIPDKEPEFSVTSKMLKKYEGTYKQDRRTVSIELKDEKLMFSFGGGQKSEITPIAKDEFMMTGANLRFEMDGEKVKQLVVEAGPRELKFTPVAASPETAKTENPEDVTETEPETVEWQPSSEESRAADRSVSSKNWPSFRGIGARGIADGQNPPIEWNVEDNQNVLWKTPIEGLGLSCPVIWDNKLFITSAVSEGDDASLRIGLYGDVASVEEDNEYEFQLLCLSKTTGEILWKQTANKKKPAVKRHAKSSHANPTTATDGKYVVAFFGSEGLFCYDMEGNQLWKQELGFLDSGWFYDPGYQWGFGSSPIIFNDLVIVQCDIQKDSFIAAFDIGTGKEVWRTEREEIPSWSSPTVHQFDGLPMLITGGTKAARGYDARTGQLLWSLKEHSEIVVPTPFVAHNLIFLASGYSPIQPIYAVRPDARGDISLDGDNLTNEFIPWSAKRGGPYMPTPIVYGDYLYCCSNNGILACFEATTGAQVYRKRMRAPGGSLAFTASPIASDGHLYLTAEDGRVLVVKAGPEFELVSTNKAGESILATPAVSEGAIYLRTQDSVLAVGENSSQ